MTRHKLKRRNKTHKQKIKRGKSRKVKQSRKLKQSRKFNQSRKCKHNKKYNKTRKLKQIHNEKIDEYKLVLNAIYKMQKLKSNKKIKNKKFVGGAIKKILVKIPQLFPNFSETPEQLAKVIISSGKCGLEDKFKEKSFNEVFNCVKGEYNKLGKAKAAAKAAALGIPLGDTGSGAKAGAPGIPILGTGVIGPDLGNLASARLGATGALGNLANSAGVIPGAPGNLASARLGAGGLASNLAASADKLGASFNLPAGANGAGLANAGPAGSALNSLANGAGPQK